MEHIIDLANTPYIWPSLTRHGGAEPTHLQPVLDVSLSSARWVVWIMGFLPAAFASKEYLLIQRE